MGLSQLWEILFIFLGWKRGVASFWRVLEDCDLLDLGFSGQVKLGQIQGVKLIQIWKELT